MVSCLRKFRGPDSSLSQPHMCVLPSHGGRHLLSITGTTQFVCARVNAPVLVFNGQRSIVCALVLPPMPQTVHVSATHRN